MARGRRNRFAVYEELLASLPKVMTKRPLYKHHIGLFRTSSGITAWIKVRFPKGGTYKGKSYAPGKFAEIKIGNLSSFSWEQLEEIRNDLQGKADREESLDIKEAPFFSTYATEWLGRLKTRKAGEQEDVIVNAHLLSEFGKKTLAAITTRDVNKFISKRNEKAQPSTVKRELNVLNAIFNDAVRLKLIEENPAKLADKVKNIVPRSRYLKHDEIKNLASKAEEEADWLTDFIKWLLASGMRRGEALALKWNDVRVLPNGNSYIHIEKSKSGKPRDIPCNAIMVSVLQRQTKRKKDKDDRVFPLSLATLKRRWRKAKVSAKLGENVTLHDLRRTYATEAMVAGVDPRTLMGLLGHSSMRMLESVYAVAVETAMREASLKIEQTFLALEAPEKPTEGQEPVGA